MPLTNGPWEVVSEKTENDNFHDSIYADGFKGLLIARCNQNGAYPEDSNLIKAAPDLYEALETLLSLEMWSRDNIAYQKSIAALKKARGE